MSQILSSSPGIPPLQCAAGPGKGGGENWDLNKALEFIEGAKAAPQSNKKVKKKKKKLAEGSGEKLEQKNHTPNYHLKELTGELKYV